MSCPTSPEAVGLDRNDKHTLSDHVLVAALINATNEHTVTLRKMQAEIEALAVSSPAALKAVAPEVKDPIDRKAAAADRVTGLKTRLAQRQTAEKLKATKLPKP